MRPFLLAALVTLAPAALADSPTARFREMLAQTRDPGPLPGLTIAYGDLAAARALDFSAVEGARLDPAYTQLRGFPLGDLSYGLRDPATDWRAAVGFAPGDVQQLLELSAPPFQAHVMALDPGVLDHIPSALAALGYAPTQNGPLTAWAHGADLTVSPGARNPDNPFGGMLGRASRVHLDGTLLRQAASWPALAALLDPTQPRLTDQPDLSAILEALDLYAPPGALAQTILIPDAGALGLSDPLAVVTGAATPPEGSVSAWRAALFADFTTGPDSTGILALTLNLPDEDTAFALANHAARTWAERPVPPSELSFGGLTRAHAEVLLHEAAPELWVLLIAQTGATERHGRGLTRGRAFTYLYAGAMRRDLVFLQP